MTNDVVRVNRHSYKHLATAAFTCFVYSACALSLMHVLRPDYVVSTHMISDYAVGPYGWIMQSVFLAMGLGTFTLMLGLALSGPATISSRIGVALLGVASIGLVVSAFFTTDLEEAKIATQHGFIHDMSFLVNILSLTSAAFLLSSSFGRDPRWRAYQRTSFLLASLVLIGLVTQILSMQTLYLYGVVNRLFVVVLYAWFMASAFWLRRVMTASSSK